MMASLESDPRGFFNNVALVLLSILIVVMVTYFGWDLLRPDVPNVPSALSFEQPAPEPVLYRSQDIVLAEDFEQDFGSWERSEVGQARYEGGALVLEDNTYDGFAWARPHLVFDNFVLEVYARWIGGAIGGAYGVEFRLNETTGEYYAFYLHNDGRYTIGKNLDREWFVIDSQYSEAINTSGGVNLIHIEAVEDEFRFFVNGDYLATVQNEGIAEGDIRLVSRKVEDTNQFVVAFDSLRIARYVGSTVSAEQAAPTEAAPTGEPSE